MRTAIPQSVGGNLSGLSFATLVDAENELAANSGSGTLPTVSPSKVQVIGSEPDRWSASPPKRHGPPGAVTVSEHPDHCSVQP